MWLGLPFMHLDWCMPVPKASHQISLWDQPHSSARKGSPCPQFFVFQTNNRDAIMLPPCAIKGHLYRFCLGFLRLQIWQVKSCLGTLHWNVRTFNDSPRTNVQWKVRVSMGDKNSNQTHPVVSFKTCSSESGTDLNHPHAYYVQSPFHSGENPVMLLAAGILSAFYDPSCNVS